MTRLLLIMAVLFIAVVMMTTRQRSYLAGGAVTITVDREPAQTFAGFGTSLFNRDGTFEKLPPDVRQSLSKALWADLNFKILRLWFTPSHYLADADKPDMSEFKRSFIDSGIIDLAKKNGCTTLLLAPDDVPDSYGDGPGTSAHPAHFTDAGVTAYAKLLAQFIKQLHDETGVQINATGILNEPNDRPIQFTLAQWPVMIKTLRAELDARQMEAVAIIAPEAASCDDTAYAMVDALKADPAAWAALQGIATHSYNMAATDVMTKKIASSAKSYWQTESSTPGPSALDDSLNAATSAARVISDLNHGVTHWLWFLGFAQDDPTDNGTRLLKYDANQPGDSVARFYNYGSLHQLSRAFMPGAEVHRCESSDEGTMTFTYGKKPALLATAALNKKGAWSVAVQNDTSNDFASDPRLTEDFRDQTGPPGKTIRVTIKIIPLAAEKKTTFTVYRSDAKTSDVKQDNIDAVNGELSLTLDPLELLTLTSVP